MQSISAFLNSTYKNHYVHFLATKTSASTVADQNGATLKIWDRTGYTAASLPGATGGILDISGVTTMESFGFRFRSDTATVSTASLLAPTQVSSHVNELLSEASGPITLTAMAAVSGGGYTLAPIADAQVETSSPNSNFGTTTNLFVEGTGGGSFGTERGWLKFDLSGIPAGSTISAASLQLWNWKSTGASMPAEVHAVTDDSWTETGITYNTQPAIGALLDTQTLASGVINTYYSWNVTSFVQSQLSGDKTVSLMVKAADESQSNASSYGFDAREFGSNAPILSVTTQATSASVANVSLFYRYSADQATYTAWTAVGAPLTAPPYTAGFTFPNGFGYYEFYSVATDNLGNTEPAPTYAQTSVHYQARSGTAQTISFGTLASSPVGSSLSLSATASSALPVTFSSLTSTVCSVSGNQLTTLTIGTCAVAADQPGNVGAWLAAPTVQRSFQVTGVAQTITFAAVAPLTVGGSTSLSATASSSLPVTFSSQTGTICGVSGTVVTAILTGTCVVAADQAGDTFWLAATTVTRSVVINGLPQTTAVAPIGDKAVNTGAFQVNPTTSSGLPATITSLTPGVCTVSGNLVTMLTVGTCTLLVQQAGNGTYGAAPDVTVSFAVTPPDGGLTDGPLPLWSIVLLALCLVWAARRSESLAGGRGNRS